MIDSPVMFRAFLALAAAALAAAVVQAALHTSPDDGDRPLPIPAYHHPEETP